MTHFTDVMEYVARGFEIFGASVLVVGLLWSLVAAGRTWRSQDGRRAYQTLRQTFGGALLLGIEVLVAADLIRTVAVTPTLASVTVLGLIVLIRTFLSFSLDVEIDGTLPWRRSPEARPSGATQAGRSNQGHDRP
jgi:uncharacterized membrane protein